MRLTHPILSCASAAEAGLKDLPSEVRVHASEKIEATRNKVAPRYGPLLYHIEPVAQGLNKVFNMAIPLGADGAVRPAQRPPVSIHWIRES